VTAKGRPPKPTKRATAATSAKVPPAKKKKLATIDTLPKESGLLLMLPEDCVLGTFQCRPSKRNRSPYVADVILDDEGREAIVHVPNLDMGGKCKLGAKLLMKPARDSKGKLVGPNGISPKYGTPKCEFIAQLLYVDESELGYKPAWVGAHPALGEKIAEELVGQNLLGSAFPGVESFKREVHNPGGANMRADFVVQHVDKELPPRILEVKTVVDTDYSVNATPADAKCVFTSDKEVYIRTGIFPWGQSKQKGPDGEKVVSARAIKHVQELTTLANDKTQNFDATVLFVVIRHDARAFRPNHEACPSFARYLKEAETKGVQILAKQVCWMVEGTIAKCYEGDLLDIDWPVTA
jgi:DNA-binding sugar fermentation-stimulating protein